MPELDKDPVNNPEHYTQGTVECIEALQSAMTPEQFIGFCRGNAIKYLWRFENKGKAAEDLEKVSWYLDRLKRAVAMREAIKAISRGAYGGE